MDVFAALADPVRRDLLLALADGPTRVSDLSARHAISRPAISRHLRFLGEAGLVAVEQRGRERHQVLRRDGLAPIAALLEALAEPGVGGRLPVGALEALETEVRRTRRERRTRQRDPGRGSATTTAGQETG